MPLRFSRLWIICGLGFVLLVIYLSLTPDPIDFGESEGLKIGHMAAYGWLMIWFGHIYRTTGRRLLLGAVFCILGVALEYLQAELPSGTRNGAAATVIAGDAKGGGTACSPTRQVTLEQA